MKKRVVITSFGVVCPLGSSEKEIFKNIYNNTPCFINSEFDSNIVITPVKEFDIKNITGRWKNSRYLNRGAQFALASAIDSFVNSGLGKKDIQEAGLFTGCGPNLDITQEFSSNTIDWKKAKALWILKFLPNTANSAISEFLGIHGENLTIGTACAASLYAIGEAFRKIKDGYLEIAFAGGGDSRLNPGGIMAYKKAQALFMGQDDPDKASRPFDISRKGFVQGEGGAFFILEELEHAQRRGACIHAEILGFGSSMDGCNMTAPDPEGIWAEKAVQHAIKEAGLYNNSDNNIDAISAHGTSTVLNDEMEAKLIARLFKNHSPVVFALKSWIGHLSAACGAVELALCLICMKNGLIPKIRNLADPCDSNIDFAMQNRSKSINTLLLENFGFGGQNSALVIKNGNNKY